MPSLPSSTLPRSRQADSMEASSVSSKTRKSSAYDENFQRHLSDHHIYASNHRFYDKSSTRRPDDLAQIRQSLLLERASLSPSQFDECRFEDFQEKHFSTSKATLMRTVVPVIAGNAKIPNEGQIPFTNLQCLTGDATAEAMPDFFDGADPTSIDRNVSKALSQKIIPTKHERVPAVPNFFLEVKTPAGGTLIAQRQACYHGAHGARAMHSLQNYGESEPIYDGRAYT